MGPLVYYCRWRGARLRLHGRAAPFVWGEMGFSDAEGEHSEPFRFNTVTWELFVHRANGWARLQLDELGVVEEESEVAGAPPMTSAGASPQ